MQTYYTIPELERSSSKKNNWLAATLLLCASGVIAVAIKAVLPTAALYVGGTTSTVQGTQPAFAYVPSTRLAFNQLQAVPTVHHSTTSSDPQVKQYSAIALAAVASGTLMFIAAAAQLVHRFFTPTPKLTFSALAQHQCAEERWSMTAATAFVGTKAPAFKATAVFDEEFVDIELSDYKGKKYIVLFFYPLDFTFVCPTEITAFSDRAAEFEALDAQILGVSVDSQFSHLAWIQTPRNQGGLGDIKYPLIADLKKDIAEAYGVLTEDGFAVRGLFIIDKEGIIQHATVNNLAFGRNVDETVRVLEALQHVQANPDEVCPAGWKKGDRTMKPDPIASKEYFKAI